MVGELRAIDATDKLNANKPFFALSAPLFTLYSMRLHTSRSAMTYKITFNIKLLNFYYYVSIVNSRPAAQNERTSSSDEGLFIYIHQSKLSGRSCKLSLGKARPFAGSLLNTHP